MAKKFEQYDFSKKVPREAKDLITNDVLSAASSRQDTERYKDARLIPIAKIKPDPDQPRNVYEGRTKMRTGEDIGDIVEEVDIQTKDGKRHRIIRRDSTQIQVFNVETGEKEAARHVMADYIDEKGMDIPHAHLNTRMIGKKLLDKLRQI